MSPPAAPVGGCCGVRGKNGDRYIWGLRRAALEMSTSCQGMHSESSQRPASSVLEGSRGKVEVEIKTGFAGQWTESAEATGEAMPEDESKN